MAPGWWWCHGLSSDKWHYPGDKRSPRSLTGLYPYIIANMLSIWKSSQVKINGAWNEAKMAAIQRHRHTHMPGRGKKRTDGQEKPSKTVTSLAKSREKSVATSKYVIWHAKYFACDFSYTRYAEKNIFNRPTASNIRHIEYTPSKPKSEWQEWKMAGSKWIFLMLLRWIFMGTKGKVKGFLEADFIRQ